MVNPYNIAHLNLMGAQMVNPYIIARTSPSKSDGGAQIVNPYIIARTSPSKSYMGGTDGKPIHHSSKD